MFVNCLSGLFLQLLPNHWVCTYTSYCTHSFWVWLQSSCLYFLLLKLSSAVKSGWTTKSDSTAVQSPDVSCAFNTTDKFRLPWNLDFKGTTSFFLSSHIQIPQLIYSRKGKLPALSLSFSVQCVDPSIHTSLIWHSHSHSTCSCCHVYRWSSCVNRLHTQREQKPLLLKNWSFVTLFSFGELYIPKYVGAFRYKLQKRECTL